MSAPSSPRRYLSIWLRRLATDRLARRRASGPDDSAGAPLVVVHMVKSALRIAAMNDAAARLGLPVGAALADARARHPAIEVAHSDPEADRRQLEAIADWCDRYTPLVALDAPSGVMLDVTGCAHLFGGEAALGRDIVVRLAAQGFRAHVAVADTPGCAWAAARYGVFKEQEPRGRSLTPQFAGADSPPLPRGERSRAQRAGEGGRTSIDGSEPPHPPPSTSTSPRRGEVKEATSAGPMYSWLMPCGGHRNDEHRNVFIVPRDAMRAALAPLPLAALRLDPDTVAALADVGLKRIADVFGLPRAALAARFGEEFLRRLDQALGDEDEPITPRRPAPCYMAEQHFAEPVARERDVLGAIGRLSIRLGYAMEARDEGARLLEAALFRTDGKVFRIAVGTGAPVRAAERIARLFKDRLAAVGEACDPGFGYDLVRLSAPVTERCAPAQAELDADPAACGHAAELGHLIDRLGARFGLRRVTRLAPQDAHIPEFAVAAVPAHAARFTLPSGRGHYAQAAQLTPPPLRGRPKIADDVREPHRDISPSPLAGEGGEDRRSEPGEGDRRNSARAQGPLTRLASLMLARRPLPRGERNYCLAHPAQDTLAPARPARLFARPERIEAIAEVPDGPPARFRWRRALHEVAAAEGPERIALAWWRDADGRTLTRDYFRVETRTGARVWLYREGLYVRETAQPRWFLHGLFG